MANEICVNAVAPELTTGFQPNLTQKVFPIVEAQTD